MSVDRPPLERPIHQPVQNSTLSQRADCLENRTLALRLAPQLLWFCLATVALAVFAPPAIRALDEQRVSKVAIGIFEIDLAQQAVAKIKDTEGIQREGIPKTWAEFKPIADRAERISNKLQGVYILWVDDKNPSQNVQERRASGSFGIQFDLASSTDEAFKWLDRAHYNAVISNVNRPGGGGHQ